MKFTTYIAIALGLATSYLAPTTSNAAPAAAPDPSHSGWLEGRVLTPDGKPVWGNAYTGVGIHVQGSRQGGGEFDVVTDISMGGLYKVQNLRPGVYTITVPKGFVSTTTTYCPQRIFGVVVKPETRSILDITCDQGDTLVETGKPNVESERIIPLAIKLEQVESELAALREQIKALKERLDLVDNSGKPMAR